MQPTESNTNLDKQIKAHNLICIVLYIYIERNIYNNIKNIINAKIA